MRTETIEEPGMLLWRCVIKIIITNTKKDFKKEGLEISFSFLPSIIYRRYTNGARVIFFAWLWITLGVQLTDYNNNYIVLKYKWMVDK